MDVCEHIRACLHECSFASHTPSLFRAWDIPCSPTPSLFGIDLAYTAINVSPHPPRLVGGGRDRGFEQCK